MKPVAIFRHARTEGPGYFGDYLDRHGITWSLVQIDQGAPVPAQIHDFSGFAFMGGPMSVNDNLPWIEPTLQLIRDAVQAELPVIGHCLGGQLMSKALGGVVGKNAVKEIGWGDIQVQDSAPARAWLGDLRAFNSFHWHGETFSIPPGATLIASSPYCAHQMFALGERHIGMQCHIEMTPELIQSWCATGKREIAESAGPSVMSVEEMQRDMDERLAALHGVADRVYGQWVKGLL